MYILFIMVYHVDLYDLHVCVYIYSVYIYIIQCIYIIIMSIHFHGPFSEPHRHAQPHDALGHGDAIAAQGIADH